MPRKYADNPKKSSSSYSPGQHGYKRKEQQRLSEKYGVEISGKTHQSEHPIGFEVLNRTSGSKRGTPGSTYQKEYKAPAYQEEYSQHRAHPGTGTSLETHASGFNSQTYRDSQREGLEGGNASIPMQLNQLAYAFDKNFQENYKNGKTPTSGQLAADDSYETMVNNTDQVQYAKGADNKTVPVSREDQQEMLFARPMARTGKWPTIRGGHNLRPR